MTLIACSVLYVFFCLTDCCSQNHTYIHKAHKIHCLVSQDGEFPLSSSKSTDPTHQTIKWLSNQNLLILLFNFFCNVWISVPPQVGHHPLQTWSVAAASSPTAAAAATGAGITATWVPPPRHPSLRWTAVPTKACRWSWNKGRSWMLKRPRSVLLLVKRPSCLVPSFLVLCQSDLRCSLLAAEFFQGCVQVSVARLWQGADILRRNKKTYPGAAPGVSFTTFDLCLDWTKPLRWNDWC